MNYFLLVVIVIVCAGAYYMHLQDSDQIATLQAEVERAEKVPPPPANPTAAAMVTPAPTASGSAANPGDAQALTLEAPAPKLATLPGAARTGPHATVLPNADGAQAGSVDAAAAAARAAADSEDIGTVTTLDHRSYTNCKVIKVDQDGVTFTDDQGITKIEFALMPPDLQKRFGYTPQGAVNQTEAEIRADQQQAAATNAAPATP